MKGYYVLDYGMSVSNAIESTQDTNFQIESQCANFQSFKCIIIPLIHNTKPPHNYFFSNFINFTKLSSDPFSLE